MKKVRVLIKATNATLYVGLGFKPDFVKIQNLNDRTGLEFDASAIAQQPYGQTVAAAGDKADAASAAAGVQLYDGEGPLASASTAKVIRNEEDVKGDITTMTVDTAASKTCHFDAALTTTKANVGSRVVFDDGTVATITALSNDGDAANDVTLDVLPNSYAVCKIFPCVDMQGAAAGKAIPPGIVIGASATVNDTAGDDLQIEAELYD